MRGKVAKGIRKSVYGDISTRWRGNGWTKLRKMYQAAKKAYM